MEREDGVRFCPLNGKERFKTRREALLASANMRDNGKGDPSVYWCEVCNAFHLTHYSYGKSKAVRQSIVARRVTLNKKHRKDMKIIIDNAYVPDGTSVSIKKLADGGEQLQLIVFDEEDKRMDLRYTYEQGLELVEAIRFQLGKMTK